MKKVIPILVMLILILSGFGASSISIDSKQIEIRDDEIDQQCIEHAGEGCVTVGRTHIRVPPYMDREIAQSFIPQKGVITKLEICIDKSQYASQDIVVGIRSELNGTNLVEKSINQSDISTIFAWYQIDIPDLAVKPNETYYIHISTECIENNFYMCSAVGSQYQQDFYTSGTLFKSENDGDWEQLHQNVDLNFKVYGKNDTTEPTVKFINPIPGNIHFFGLPLISTQLKYAFAFGGFTYNSIKINATDDYTNKEDLIVKVYKDDDLLGIAEYDSEEGYYTLKWNETGVSLYELKAVAEDLSGNTAEDYVDIVYIKFISLF